MAKKTSKEKKLGMAQNMTAAASLTGFAPETVAAAKNAGCPAFNRRGEVDCDELRRWVLEHPEIAASTGKVDFALEEGLKMRADRMLKEHKLELARRGVVPVDEMRRAFTRSVVAAKAKLRSSEKTIGMKVKMRLALSDEHVITLGEILSQEHREIEREMSKGEWFMQTCPHCKVTI